MDAAEFTLRRSRNEYNDWVDAWSIQGINRYESLLRRSEPWDKKMLEEAIPVQKYIRLFYRDRNDISIELNAERGTGVDGFDAKITSPTGRVIENLQVSIVPAKDEHIDRLIASGGYTFPADEDRPEPVKKTWYDAEEHLRQLGTFCDLPGYADLVIARIRKKTKNAYQQPCILLIVLDPDMIVEEVQRFRQVIAMIEAPGVSFGPFSKIVVTAFGTGLVHVFDTNSAGSTSIGN